jgi:hypothetical protein
MVINMVVNIDSSICDIASVAAYLASIAILIVALAIASGMSIYRNR